MLVWGKNVFNEIDTSKIRKVYIDKNKEREFIPYLKEHKLRYDLVDKRVLDDMSAKNHQGIVLLHYNYQI